MARAFVCAYFDWLDTFAKCNDAEFGRLVRAALRYARDGETPSFAEGGREEILWDGLASQLRRDTAKYDRRSRNGTKSVEKRWNKGVEGTTEPAQGTGRNDLDDMKRFLESMPADSSTN